MSSNPQISKRFQLLQRLGEGGMGVVYEALDQERNAKVALKTILRVSPDALVRFKREFRALQDVHHPNLVSLGELISEGDQWFFTMELVHGVSFLEHVRPGVSVSRVRVAGSTPRGRQQQLPLSGANDATVPFERGDSAPMGALDETRLRAALPQLVRGLAALHSAGKVHRDVKPSNVRVTPEGRVVVLDFGLIGEQARTTQSTDTNVVGTPAYMSPEQAASAPVGPEADFYAVGVILYEALTGQLPFDGAPLQILMKKQLGEPPPPKRVAPSTPDDLNDLCERLLRFEPSERPTAEQLLRVLGDDEPRDGVDAAPSSSITHAAPFIGRAREIAALDEAYADAASGRCVIVLLEGESGVGKSCLVRRFTDRLADDHEGTLVLAGRCYERESVPYKALDGVIDAIARSLAKLPDAKAAAMLPDHVGALVQVFPVLRRVRVFAAESQVQGLDPHELRRRAFGAVRQLLARMAAKRRVVVVIDDLQWTDADSLSLLEEVLRPPDAPPLLLIGTLRAGVVHGLGAAFRGDVRRVPVERLSHDDACQLAALLLARAAPSKRIKAAAIADETRGHPLFIDELVRHAAMSVGDGAPMTVDAVKLDEALWARVACLDASARELVELLAVAGAPVTQECLAHALGMEMAEFARKVAMLRVANLVATRGARATDHIETYHDRVREAVIARLDPKTKTRCHKRLALALEAQHADPEALSVHWAGAGDATRAGRYAITAAEQAQAALAFDRAASWWQRALDLHVEEDAVRRGLRVKLADAFANAGRGALAAEAYQSAAEYSNAAEALDLRRRAAEQLLRSGHFDRGLAVARDVLKSVRLSLPSSPLSALVQLVFWRVILAVRGLRFRERDASLLPAEALMRIDTCYSLALGLAMTDQLYSALFNARAMMLALRSGELFRVARSIAIESALRSIGGGPVWTQTRALMKLAEQLAQKSGRPEAVAWALGTSAAAFYLHGQFKKCLERADKAAALFLQIGSTAANEVVSAQLFAANSLFYLGDLDELSRRVPRYIQNAIDRGDVYAEVIFHVGFPNTVWLVNDDPDGARAVVGAAMRKWSKQGFHLEHFYEMLALCQTDLYVGDPNAAYLRVADVTPRLRRSLVGRIQSVRILLAYVRARASIAMAAVDPAKKAPLLAGAEADARQIERERMAWSHPIAALMRAGIACVRGDTAAALARLRDATPGFVRSNMLLHAATARVAEGLLVGDEAGRKLAAESTEWLRSKGVKRPARFAAMLAAGLPVDCTSE